MRQLSNEDIAEVFRQARAVFPCDVDAHDRLISAVEDFFEVWDHQARKGYGEGDQVRVIAALRRALIEARRPA